MRAGYVSGGTYVGFWPAEISALPQDPNGNDRGNRGPTV